MQTNWQMCILTNIFNVSLSTTILPTCLTIVPVPKKSSVSCLNVYCFVAITPIMMKCFRRLVMKHLETLLPSTLNPLQLVYRSSCSTDDAITTTLHLTLIHLDNKDTYTQIRFIDFSSAFNTILPQHLIDKLSLLGLNTSLCNWILDFLAERPQSVQIGNSISRTTTLSTGAAQGGVLSLMLFTLLTHNCDDVSVVGLSSKNDESAYNLFLNVDQRKEMIIDRQLRRSQESLFPP
ncbi:uncharacterized protein LOC114775579 [Denticeps clupeoides]|uniref:uncharacterized protein LOC114775579 n=1 Tax=Denticeps clupeoides TaxID=299321 RepID=UPI0010A4E79A|nr:uncharacterized protein LOC114775579 [Denticeps clupeoides]